jgi:hypothetical protein
MAAKEAAALIGDVTKVTDGQIALTAHNNGDGTWSVTLGPGGVILEDGLPREKALAIVGAKTYPYEPGNKREQEAAELREEVEERASKVANEDASKSDFELGLVDKKGRRILPDEPEQRRAPGAGGRRGAANNPQSRAKNGEG